MADRPNNSDKDSFANDGEPQLPRGLWKRKSQGKSPHRIYRDKHKAKHHTFRDTTKRLGFTPAGENSASHPNAHKSGKVFKPGFFSLCFGVLLPLAALIVETTTHQMAQSYFDPFPTLSHVFLFLLIPISNFITWLSVRTDTSPLYSITAIFSGMALGIGILYSIMLLPVTPMFLATTIFGVGFLGLAPLLSIPITLLSGKTICQLGDRHNTFFDAHQLKHLGHIIILVMVIAVELPSTLTRMHLGEAVYGNQQDAVKWLRKWGSHEVLLRACYERSGEATDILGSLAEHQRPVPIDQARNIYYKVTGVAYNSVPIPSSFRGTIKNAGLISDPAGLNADVKDEFDLDPDIAGELVSGVARGLSVSQSAISGKLDSNAGIASIDWDFTFENVSTIPREARAKIVLPPNAVVTKATMWLDDLERETTIMPRGLARETYQAAVVSHKRDPLLISIDGKDTALVQCYPVMKGTKTKIRLHIAAPMETASKTEEAVVLPTFGERNFAITIPHKIQMVSSSKMSIPNSKLTVEEKNKQFSIMGDLDNSLLARFAAIPHVVQTRVESNEPAALRPRDVAPAAATSASSLPYIVGQPSKGVIVVVDQSITMAPYMEDIVAGLKAAPTGLPMTIIAVHDQESTLCEGVAAGAPSYTSAIETLSKSACEGGQQNSGALQNLFAARAYEGRRGDSTAEVPKQDILWIHAAQPIGFCPVQMQAALSQNSSTPALYDLQVASGPNEILVGSHAYPALARVARSGSLQDDISKFLRHRKEGLRPATIGGITTGATNEDLPKVQANKLVLARYYNQDLYGAYELAQRYHIVTPVSSAVVTEDVTDQKKLAEAAKREESAQKQAAAKSPLNAMSKFMASKESELKCKKMEVSDIEFIPSASDEPVMESEKTGRVASSLVAPPPPSAPAVITENKPAMVEFYKTKEGLAPERQRALSFGSPAQSPKLQLKQMPASRDESGLFKALDSLSSAAGSAGDKALEDRASGNQMAQFPGAVGSIAPQSTAMSIAAPKESVATEWRSKDNAAPVGGGSSGGSFGDAYSSEVPYREAKTRNDYYNPGAQTEHLYGKSLSSTGASGYSVGQESKQDAYSNSRLEAEEKPVYSLEGDDATTIMGVNVADTDRSVEPKLVVNPWILAFAAIAGAFAFFILRGCASAEDLSKKLDDTRKG